MNKLAMFVPLAKADAAQRLVYGYFDETPDRSREIFDYESSKPNVQAWSDSFAKATDGLSVGNIRAQHGKVAAGKLEKIHFDDENRRVEFCARIVDDNEWAKVEAGVYTGFSPGGRYAKRWADPNLPGHNRYTAQISELSIVDVPCNPAATFTMVKADGIEQEVEFVLAKAYEPGNEATKARAEDMAKAADGTTWKDHVAQARADLIAENATAELAKMAGEQDAAEPEPAHDPVSGVSAEVTSKLDAALAKADATLQAGDGPVSPAAAYAAALTGTMLKCATDLPVAPPSAASVALIGVDLAKSLAALEAIRVAAEPILEKGLYEIGDVVKTLQSMSWIAQCVTDEAGWERDGSPLPQMAVDLVKGLKGFLVAMVEEEVSELLARTKAGAGEGVSLVIESGDEMELAQQIVDLVKQDTARMEKAGARNSRGDAARIQTIHDKAAELGAACAHDTETVEKVNSLTALNDQLTKSIDKAVPAIEQLTAEVETMRSEREADREEMAKMAARIEELGGQPAPTKIQLAVAHAKEEDNGTLSKDADDKPLVDSLANASKLSGAARAKMLERIAINAKHAIPA